MKFAILFVFSYLFAISDYRVVNFCISKHTLAIREFKQNDKEKLLIVNTNTLKTSIIPKIDLKTQCDLKAKYFKLLNQKPKLQNAGVTKSKHPVLSVDFCPSSKRGFDKIIFTSLIKKQKNAPVIVFMSKNWIKHHKKSFELLKKWQKEKKLNILWGNHTATHPYIKHLPLNKNFVLIKGYDLKKDILNNEIYLINNGVTPSIFFRFPGLISDKKTLKIVNSLGLIAIGSNTWLAKGEKVTNHSIILIHGNKNEEKGVKIFLQKLKNIKKLYPLNESL
ncbi:polysaccharide deacetylase family protein [Caminibacter pacificus]